jgi:hypothetical protein
MNDSKGVNKQQPLISRDAFDIEGDDSPASMKPLSNAIVEVLALF